jgi:TolA-binding protein
MNAPFQCRRDPDPKTALEESPGEALYQLATEMRARGNIQGWRDTLAYLVKRYPASRYARIAKDELAADGQGNK